MMHKIDLSIPLRFTPDGIRNMAHGYERLHFQHPRLRHSELIQKMLSDLYDYLSALSSHSAGRLINFQGTLHDESYSLGGFIFNLGLAESEISTNDLSPETILRLRNLIDNEITSVLGYLPDSSESAVAKRTKRDANLETEAGYSQYLKQTFGVGAPYGFPELPLENAVLQSRKEWEEAMAQVSRLGLPAHFQREKNWDSLSAIDCILRRTSKKGVILDAGTELYSVFLPSLFLYGYHNLTGINVVFEQPLTLGGIRYQHGDITRTTFPAETFDAIACLSVVEHGIDLEAYFREAARILKVGGLLITSTDYYPTPVDTKNAFAYGTPIHIFTEEEIEDALRIASEFGLQLTSPLNLGCKEAAVTWDDFDLNYSFVIFTLKKTAPCVA